MFRDIYTSRRIGNSFSRRYRQGGLPKRGMIGVAFMLIFFCGAAIYVMLPTAPPSAQESFRSSANLIDSGKLRATRSDWIDAQAENIAEEIVSEVEDEYLVLTLSDELGPLEIELLPELSPESIDYLRKIVEESNKPNSSCERCMFYRADKPGIFQGVMASKGVPPVSTPGACPRGFEFHPNDCPAHDPHCGCHGPVMTRGMVAWAGGKTGPDFFIDAYDNPVTLWGTQHTVWGELTPESLTKLGKIWALPTHRGPSGMTFLDKTIPFTMHIAKGGASRALSDA